MQAEFSLTQVLDRPVHGRLFFEQVIRENLDLGRPDEVQLIFNRKITSRTPGRFRTRILTQDVTPSLNVYYKNTRIKQYHKENRALRTETTINNSYDFGIGKRLCNLPKLREIGFAANRRLLEIERISHDCMLAEDTVQTINSPITAGRQRASGLRFADPRVHSLWHALILFRLLPDGFRSADLRKHLFTDEGKLRSFVNVYVNDEDIRYLAKENTPTKDGDTISIIPSIAGGNTNSVISSEARNLSFFLAIRIDL